MDRVRRGTERLTDWEEVCISDLYYKQLGKKILKELEECLCIFYGLEKGVCQD